jgi:hypothetical protein
MTSGKWATSDRRSRLPGNWRQLVLQARQRSGGRCEFIFPNGGRCRQPANGGVDHHVDPDDHRLESLRDLCHDHHMRKTQREALAARKTRQNGRLRPEEPHPGAMRREEV